MAAASIQKRIEKMRIAMVACDVDPVLIEQVVASIPVPVLFASPAVPSVGAVAAERFFAEKFWPNYPKRAGSNPKEPARKKLVQLIVSGENPETILEGLRRLVRGLRARDKVGTEFVPMAMTWINRKGWRDDPEPDGPNGGMPMPTNGGGGFFGAAAQLRRNAGQ
jgi:hypothetical protein